MEGQIMAVIEFWQYKLKEGPDVKGFLEASESVQNDFLVNQRGFLPGREIFRGEDGLWTEVVRWETMDNAKNAINESKTCQYCHKLFSFIDVQSARQTYLEERQRFGTGQIIPIASLI
jgi:hypothetical protein